MINSFLYEFHTNANATDVAENICNAYGDKAISVSQCQRWFKKLRSVDFSLQDLPRLGAEKVLDNIDLRVLIKSDNTQTVVQLTEQLGCSESTVYNHLKILE